ncbi:dihydrodipicolinate synthase family protein [Halococcus saccharolyticus]|uniref:Dihydrodipicolinate synthase n=1 Tax=Halococcus saccharolyticus DSM 5350 TaxID=1227455 RepID=M0MI08_9EURY|nr:dihydrodipicolinate synthase family protein [Halococcus saccharolyticus]EMA44973.1 dihydrodipicolinate synthase [Halococcus saccharolyticus DSM 5350]
MQSDSNPDPLSSGGVIPPTVTAFHGDESVDYGTTAAHARFVVDRGVDGVFPLGTNGEFALLDAEESVGVIEAVVDEVGGEVPVIAGVGAVSTYHTVRNAERAADAGADGVMIVTPYYYPLDDEGAIEHYQRVADAIDLPIYVYHIPGRTGNELSRGTLAELAEIDAIAGIKDSSKDVPWLGQTIATNPDLTVLPGADSLQFVGRVLGGVGGVSAIANAFPEIVVDLHDAYDAGDRDRARDLQETLYRIRAAFDKGPYMAGVKGALSLQGFDAGPLRSPLRRLTDEQKNELERDLQGLGVL